MAQQATGSDAAGRAAPGASNSGNGAASSVDALPSTPQPPKPSPAVLDRDPAPESAVQMKLLTRDALRGSPVRVEGRVTADQNPCAFARVDIWLVNEAGDRSLLGALPTDQEGRFSGAVTVLMSMDVGQYDVTATTPGTHSCGPSRDASR
jgi:protocatechuate 3,4-dioxygenase beta subunit